MKRALIGLVVAALSLAGACTSSAQTTYMQKVDAEGRSGYLNFFGVELYDSSGTLRGNYSLECNRNTINTITCQFALTLDSVSYVGKVTQVDTYFPFNDADSDDHGPFKYEWSATSSGNVTLTGSSAGNGHWVYNHGYQPVIEAGTTVTVNGGAASLKPFYPCGSKHWDCLHPTYWIAEAVMTMDEIHKGK